jgi:hypothetical protein
MQGTRAYVRRIVGEGKTEVQRQIPFSPRAERMLEYVPREALAPGHTTLSASTSCSDWCENPTGWPPASRWTSTSTVRRFAAGCADCRLLLAVTEGS